jgi:hypothetical protein
MVGVTNAVFDFTTTVTEKVNRTFSIGTFSEPISLEDLDIEFCNESRRIQQLNLEFIQTMMYHKF